MGIAKFEIRRKCMVCGEPFMAKTVESWYCSPRCSKIAYKRRRDEEIRHSKLDVIVRKIPKSQEYVKVSESVPFENVLNVAMLLCMNYVDAATTVSESCGGGGSTPSNWGRTMMRMSVRGHDAAPNMPTGYANQFENIKVHTVKYNLLCLSIVIL